MLKNGELVKKMGWVAKSFFGQDRKTVRGEEMGVRAKTFLPTFVGKGGGNIGGIIRNFGFE